MIPLYINSQLFLYNELVAQVNFWVNKCLHSKLPPLMDSLVCNPIRGAKVKRSQKMNSHLTPVTVQGESPWHRWLKKAFSCSSGFHFPIWIREAPRLLRGNPISTFEQMIFFNGEGSCTVLWWFVIVEPSCHCLPPPLKSASCTVQSRCHYEVKANWNKMKSWF